MKLGVREFIFLILLAAVPVAGYFLVLQPRNNQVLDARREIASKQTKLRQLEQQTRNVNELGEEIEKLQNAVALAEQKLPAEREVEVILKEVWQMAAKHGLSPKKVQTDKALATAQYAQLPIKMSIVGDFDGFYSFMLDLEKLPRITRMPEMMLKKATDNEGQMSADVVLHIFFESGGTSNRGIQGKGRL